MYVTLELRHNQSAARKEQASEPLTEVDLELLFYNCCFISVE